MRRWGVSHIMIMIWDGRARREGASVGINSIYSDRKLMVSRESGGSDAGARAGTTPRQRIEGGCWWGGWEGERRRGRKEGKRRDKRERESGKVRRRALARGVARLRFSRRSIRGATSDSPRSSGSECRKVSNAAPGAAESRSRDGIGSRWTTGGSAGACAPVPLTQMRANVVRVQPRPA
jgi:hypothetical protein